MSREYVPIFFDWIENTQDLSAEEKGHLIDAVILYASGSDEWIDQLKTSGEKIAFRFMRGQIDRNAAISQARVKAGSNKKKQTETNENKTEQTETNSPKEKEKEKEKDNNNKKQKTNTCSPLFENFWKAYPKHINRKAAEKAFEKLKPDDDLVQTMLDAIEKQKQTSQWQESGGQFIPYPASWINGRRWEDEVQGNVSPIKPVVAQDYEQRDYSEPVYSSPEDMIKRLNEEMGIQPQGRAI